MTLITLHGLDRQAGQILHPQAMAAVPGPAGDGVQTTAADAGSLAALELAVARLTRPGEPIFVADPRHDVVHTGDPLLYVILGHPNPTRYDVMQPGLVTSAPVQREIVASLERSHTRVVIRWLDPRAFAPEHDGADVLEPCVHPRPLPRPAFPARRALRRLPAAGSVRMSDRFSFPREELRRRTVRGALVTGGFLILIDGFVLVQGLVVTRLLGPSEIGLYGVVSTFVISLIALKRIGIDEHFVQQDEARPGAGVPVRVHARARRSPPGWR